jgi:hypothetical protein
MPVDIASIMKTSMSGDSAANNCWNKPSRSEDDGEVVTSLTVLPVFFAHASTPSLQIRAALPTESHAIDKVAAHDAPGTALHVMATIHTSALLKRLRVSSKILFFSIVRMFLAQG